jgi:hypothetical protein
MPLVSYSCSAPAPGDLALKVLSKIQDTTVDFVEDASPSLKVVTVNPVIGSSTTSTSVSWVGCARTLSQMVPSLSLWDGPLVESWVESAVNTVIPVLQASGRFIDAITSFAHTDIGFVRLIFSSFPMPVCTCVFLLFDR